MPGRVSVCRNGHGKIPVDCIPMPSHRIAIHFDPGIPFHQMGEEKSDTGYPAGLDLAVLLACAGNLLPDLVLLFLWIRKSGAVVHVS
jgi:hypothetical protein